MLSKQATISAFVSVVVAGSGIVFAVVDSIATDKKEAAEKAAQVEQVEQRKADEAKLVEARRRADLRVREAIAAPQTFTGTNGRMTASNGEQTRAQIYNGRISAMPQFECVIVKTTPRHFLIAVLNPNGSGHVKFSVNGETKDGGGIQHKTDSDGLHLYSGGDRFATLEFDRTETFEESQALEALFQMGIQNHAN
ncbi:MAG: hypothetical protein ACRC62_15700 [Microcoleus sp.]